MSKYYESRILDIEILFPYASPSDVEEGLISYLSDSHNLGITGFFPYWYVQTYDDQQGLVLQRIDNHIVDIWIFFPYVGTANGN